MVCNRYFSYDEYRLVFLSGKIKVNGVGKVMKNDTITIIELKV